MRAFARRGASVVEARGVGADDDRFRDDDDVRDGVRDVEDVSRRDARGSRCSRTRGLAEQVRRLALAVPGLFMNAIEWWSWDLNTVLAGLCAKATLELDAQTFLSNTYLFFYSVACLWARGAATAVGNALGAKKPNEAATYARATVVLSLGVALVAGAVFRVNADAVFSPSGSSRAPFVARLNDLVDMLTAFIVLDAVQVALGGVIVGAGYQVVTTPILVVAYWVVGLRSRRAPAVGHPGDSA